MKREKEVYHCPVSVEMIKCGVRRLACPCPMRRLKIKTPNGITLRFCSDEPLTGKQVLTDIRLAMALDDELGDAVIHPDELARRIAAKGYDPKTGKPIH